MDSGSKLLRFRYTIQSRGKAAALGAPTIQSEWVLDVTVEPPLGSDSLANVSLSSLLWYAEGLFHDKTGELHPEFIVVSWDAFTGPNSGTRVASFSLDTSHF